MGVLTAAYALLVVQSQATRVRFAPATLDIYGFVPWTHFGPISEPCRAAAPLVKRGDWEGAAKILRKGWMADSLDLVAMQGYADSMRHLHRLPTYFTEVANRITDPQLRLHTVPPPLILAYQYGLGQLAYVQNEGERPDFNPSGSRSRGEFVYGYLNLDSAALMPDNRVGAVLYVSATLSGTLYGEARRASRICLAKHQDFVELRLLYSASLAGGSVKRTVGNVDVSVPADERPDIVRAIDEIRTAIRISPNWPPAYYIAGVLVQAKEPEQAMKYFTKFVAMVPSDDPHRQTAKEFLARLTGTSK